MMNLRMPIPLYLRKKLGGYQTGGGIPFSAPTPKSVWDYPTGQKPDMVVPANDGFEISDENQWNGKGTGVTPINPNQKDNTDYLGIARDTMYTGNTVLRQLSENYAQGQQQDYLNTNLANPLASLPINDGRSDGVKYGYQQFQMGGRLPPSLKKGGIHIKKENKGKFTEYKQRTGKTTEEALHSDDPHVRQMANFAKNASHWKHKMGGKYRGKNC